MTHVVHILVGGEFLLEERPLSRPLILCDVLNLATSLHFACSADLLQLVRLHFSLKRVDERTKHISHLRRVGVEMVGICKIGSR